MVKTCSRREVVIQRYGYSGLMSSSFDFKSWVKGFVCSMPCSLPFCDILWHFPPVTLPCICLWSLYLRLACWLGFLSPGYSVVIIKPINTSCTLTSVPFQFVFLNPLGWQGILENHILFIVTMYLSKFSRAQGWAHGCRRAWYGKQISNSLLSTYLSMLKEKTSVVTTRLCCRGRQREVNVW